MTRSRCLVLNSSFKPHSIISDRDAVGLILDGDAEMIVGSEFHFHSAGSVYENPIAIRVPLSFVSSATSSCQPSIGRSC